MGELMRENPLFCRMKNIPVFFFAIPLILISISCKRNSPDIDQPVDPIETNPNDKSEPDKITPVNWTFESFFVSDVDVQNIFPGAIFDIQSKNDSYKLVSLDGKYTPLSIVASASIFLPNKKSFNGLPSSNEIKEYVKDLSAEENVLGVQSKADRFKDYNVIKYDLANNSDVDAVFKALDLAKSTRITKKYGLKFLYVTSQFSLDMNLPKVTELISSADADKLFVVHNPYYISGVYYGSIKLILAESDGDFDSLKYGLSALVAHKELSPAQIKALENAKITFYSRGGAEKTFIKVADHLEATKVAFAAFEAYNKSVLAYPVSYRLRSLKDYGLFKTSVKINIIE